MAAPVGPERAHQLRRRHLHERQAVVFGSLVAALAVTGLGAAAVYTGVIAAPFLERDFTEPSPEPTEAGLPPAPCPPEGTLPAPYTAVQITVLNGSNRSGLAGQTSTELAARGFTMLTPGDYPTNIDEHLQIRFGEAGLAAAYTLASQVADPVLVLDTRADATVDLVLGEEFAGLSVDGFTLDPAVPLVGLEGCVALETARVDAQPGPTASPSPTEEALQDGGEGFEDAPTDG